MLRHIVLLRFRPDADASARKAIREAIGTFRAHVPEIRDLQCGDSVSTSPDAYDFAVVMDFEDRAAFERYLASPAHRAYVAGPARAAVASLAATQHTW